MSETDQAGQAPHPPLVIGQIAEAEAVRLSL
jgi:hypothetical protein